MCNNVLTNINTDIVLKKAIIKRITMQSNNIKSNNIIR